MKFKSLFVYCKESFHKFSLVPDFLQNQPYTFLFILRSLNEDYLNHNWSVCVI